VIFQRAEINLHWFRFISRQDSST